MQMKITRRKMIKAGMALPVLATVGSGCGNDVSAAPIVEAEVNDTPTSSNYGKIEIAVPRYPDLAAVGGAVMLRLAPLPPGTRPFDVPEKGVLLVHRGADGDPPEFIATRADCPHQGCPLGYNPKEQMIECPCHSSRFLATSGGSTNPELCIGKVVHLPAQDNLTVYQVKRLGDFVYVNLNVDQSCGVSNAIPAVVNGKITIPVAMFPALQNPGGKLVGKPDGLGDTLLIARTDATTIHCVSAICTHRRCTVSFPLEEGQFHCFCHDSTFTYDGEVTGGPAPSALKKYDVSFDGTTAVITVA